jgi:hypothetical protein
MHERLIEASLFQQFMAQVRLRGSVVRVDGNGVFERGHGLKGPAFVSECRAEIIFDHEIVTGDGEGVFVKRLVASAWMRAHSSNGSSIAVLGSEPEIPFYADRHSATGYMYVYPLMEPQPFALTMQEEMIHDVESARPEYVVVVTGGGSWAQRRGSPTLIFDWWRAYRAGHYKRVGLVDIISYDHTEYRWGGDVDSYGVPSPRSVVVYKRI